MIVAPTMDLQQLDVVRCGESRLLGTRATQCTLIYDAESVGFL